MLHDDVDRGTRSQSALLRAGHERRNACRVAAEPAQHAGAENSRAQLVRVETASIKSAERSPPRRAHFTVDCNLPPILLVKASRPRDRQRQTRLGHK